MGEGKRKQYHRNEFLKEHPVCCYCGGAATTTDHCPPRSLFEQRQWPEGYEFPACGPCNAEGRKNEQVIAALYRISVAREDRYVNETKQLIKGVVNNSPEIAAEWLSETRNWRKNKLREGFGSLGDDMRRLGYGVAKLGDKTHEAINYFGKKLGMALYYKHIGRRLVGRLFCKSISLTNNELLKSSLEFAPGVAELQRASKSLSDQFTYRYNFNSDVGVFYGVVGFKEQLGYLIWAFEQDFYEKNLEAHPDLPFKLEETFPERYVCT
jgi:hypothetical protein